MVQAKPSEAKTADSPSRLSPEAIAEMFRRFQQVKPAPESELDYRNPYTLLVAVVLSAQATDEGVNRATKELFDVADTPEKMVALGEERVRDMIKTIGLYRNKAKNVIALSQKLIDEFGGEIPRDRAALESCQARRPDILLLDWNMPVMDGMEFLAAISEDEKPARPKVIFCTSGAESAPIIRAMAAGASEYLVKPFDKDLLASKFATLGLA
jgi:hypothetical protein